ncbi:MAG: VWA domain-containing protein [Acidobacteriales bacterium]|nr:VWA domain-containing protein [Terriglobales bacterium]
MHATIATLLSGLLIASAQQQPIPRGAFKFETTTQLVVVNVGVKDKGGKPVEGLKASDFTITEDGKPQKISVFEFQRLEEPVAVPAERKLIQRGTESAPKAAPAAQPAAPAQIAPSKPGEIRYRDRRLLVMFFDLTSMPASDQIRAQKAALKFLDSQMTASDMMAVMTFSSDLKVLQDFTNDRDALIRTIKGINIGEGSDMAVNGATSGDETAADTGDAYTADDTEFNIFNTDRKLAAIETASRMLSSLPEKKALIYFASGMTKTGVDNEAQMRATVNAAIRSNVSLYPIDARGLVAQAPLGDATKASPGGQGMYSGSAARTTMTNLQDQQESLYTLAADTGGKALLDENDLSLGIQQAQKDIASYYILGYYSTNQNMDGRYRRIKVQLTNKSLSAKLDYRSGYFASKQFRDFNSTDRERQLQEALMLGDPVTDLPIAMEVAHFRLARDRYFVPLTVKIPGSELELAKHGGAERARLDFIGQVKDAKGSVVATVRDDIDVKLKGENAGQLSKRNLQYDTGFTLQPGAYTVKFLARENATGKMGTFEMKFKVPDLTNERNYLPISSVVLSNQRESLKAAVATVERDKKLLQANPLVQDGEKLVPSVTRVFRTDQEMYVYVEAYQPTAQSTEPLVASVSFFRGKQKAFETQPLQVTEGLNPKTKAVPIRFSLSLSKLTPGRYTCQVSVLDPTARKFAFWRAPVVVIPKPAA